MTSQFLVAKLKSETKSDEYKVIYPSIHPQHWKGKHLSHSYAHESRLIYMTECKLWYLSIKYLLGIRTRTGQT